MSQDSNTWPVILEARFYNRASEKGNISLEESRLFMAQMRALAAKFDWAFTANMSFDPEDDRPDVPGFDRYAE